jgi:hypothetical protein
MKNILFFILSLYGYSQCLSGDCNSGEGKYRFTKPIISSYEGKFSNGLPNGKGKIEYSDWGVSYDGFFIDGNIDSTAYGILQMKNIIKKGNISESVLKDENGNLLWNWVLNGEGSISYSNGNVVEEGFFNEDELNGKGVRTLRSEKGIQSEIGNFVNGVLNDINGEIIYFDGDRYVGGIRNGKPQGKGKLITPSGGIKLDGTWFEGEWLEVNKNNPYGIDIKYNGNSIFVDVEFGSVKIPMVLDTGASVVTLNKTQFYALAALNLIKVKNVQDGTFQIASGDYIEGKIYTIDQLKIGSYKINDIECSVLDSATAPNLLGLNAILKNSKSFSIDIKNLKLNF